MCNKLSFKFPCKHEKVFWSHCNKATPKQRALQQPCDPGYPVPDLGVKSSANMENCCSTECCQKDIDSVLHDLESAEELYNKKARYASFHSRNLPQATDRFVVAIDHHFTICLPYHDLDKCDQTIRNNYREMMNEPLLYPMAPTIPNRDEIKGNMAAYQACISKWETYVPVAEDRQAFIDRYGEKRALSEKDLTEIYEKLEQMLQQLNSAQQIRARLADMRALQDHLETVESLGADPNFHDLEYVMQMKMYGKFRKQTFDISHWMTGRHGGMSTVHSLTGEMLADNMHMWLRELMAYLSKWASVQSPTVRQSIANLEQDQRAYEEARKRYLASKVRQQTIDKGQSSHLAQSHSSPSVRVTSAFSGSIFEEPKSTQPESHSDSTADHQIDHRKRRKNGPGSQSSSVSLGDRPTSRKKGKHADHP